MNRSETIQAAIRSCRRLSGLFQSEAPLPVLVNEIRLLLGYALKLVLPASGDAASGDE